MPILRRPINCDGIQGKNNRRKIDRTWCTCYRIRTNSIAIGNNAFVNKTNGSLANNTMAIGNNTEVTMDNSVCFGLSFHHQLFLQGRQQ